MKKIVILLISMFVFVSFTNGQKVYQKESDTLKGAETVKFPSIQSSSSSGTLTLQATCTELGGTSDGTLILEGSVDGSSFNTITEKVGLFTFYPNDTLTITDGSVMQVVIVNSPFKFYRYSGTGTASDTTIVDTKFLPKIK